MAVLCVFLTNKKYFKYILSLFLLSNIPAGFAATIDWSSSSSSGDFNTSANWIGGVIPGSAYGNTNLDIANFSTSNTKTITFSNNWEVGGFTVNDSGYFRCNTCEFRANSYNKFRCYNWYIYG